MGSPPHRAAAIALALVVAGCQRPTATGTVQDVTGAPLEGARVTVVGTLCQDITDDAGRFSLSCQPEPWKVMVVKKGYVSEEVDVDASEGDDHDLGTRTLVPIPEGGSGLYVYREGAWHRPGAGVLERRLDPPRGMPDRRSYCLLPDESASTEVPADELLLYEKGTTDWSLFRLDDDGCARHLTRDGRAWKIEYSEQPHSVGREVGGSQRLHTVDLEPGEYFLAWWRGGNFVETSASQDGPRRYAGFHLVTAD